MTHADFPFRTDARGRTAGTDAAGHLHDLIELVLFTSPGERVNRPTFGCGLLQLAFRPNGDELAAATQFLVQGALQQWLGDRILVEDVRVTHADGKLEVTVQYAARTDQQRRVARFSRGV